MNKRQIIILSVVFTVLVLGLAVKFLVRLQDSRVAKEVYTSLSFSLDPAKVEKVILKLGANGAPVELVKKNGVWSVSSLWNAKADAPKITKLLEAVQQAKGELRSADSAILKDFRIGDADAVSLKFLGAADTELLDLKVGTTKAGFDGFFVRRSGSPEVYFVDTPFDQLLGIFMPMEEAVLSANFWADLTLLSLDPEKVNKITISHLKGGAVTAVSGVERLEQKDAPSAKEGGPMGTAWKLVGPQQARPVDPDKVLRYIVKMNSAKAKGVVDPAGKEYGLEKPVWRLSVMEGEKPVILEAGSKNEKENVYFVKVRDLPQVFQLASDFWGDLDAKDEQFLKDAPKPEAVKDAKGPA
jgi:hypothetical protein